MKYVYLIRDRRSGLTKIGVSKHPDARLRDLSRERTKLPFEMDLYLMDAFEGSFQDEHHLHREYSRKHVRGEWFDLSLGNTLDISSTFDHRSRHFLSDYSQEEECDA